MSVVARYIVHADHVEEVGELSARRHRQVLVDEVGDVVVVRSDTGEPLAWMSRAELRYVSRAVRREARRRFWRRLFMRGAR